MDEVDGFHNCRICKKTFKVRSDKPFEAKYAVHKNSKVHKEAKEKLLSLLAGSGSRAQKGVIRNQQKLRQLQQ